MANDEHLARLQEGEEAGIGGGSSTLKLRLTSSALISGSRTSTRQTSPRHILKRHASLRQISPGQSSLKQTILGQPSSSMGDQ